MPITTQHIAITTAIAICRRAGINVTSEPAGRRFRIVVNDNGEVIRYDKKVYASEVSAAINKTWKHYALKVLKKQREQ